MTRLRLSRSFTTPDTGAAKTLRQLLQHHRQGDGLRAAGQFQQQAVDGDRVKPVAQFADDLGGPQQPEVAVVANQPPVRREGD